MTALADTLRKRPVNQRCGGELTNHYDRRGVRFKTPAMPNPGGNLHHLYLVELGIMERPNTSYSMNSCFRGNDCEDGTNRRSPGRSSLRASPASRPAGVILGRYRRLRHSEQTRVVAGEVGETARLAAGQGSYRAGGLLLHALAEEPKHHDYLVGDELG